MNNESENEVVDINYGQLIKNYFDEFYYGTRLLGGRISLEKLQLNYRLTALPRVNKYLDNPPNVVRTDADRIATILNFELEFNRETGHAIQLEIKNNGSIINRVSFYNFGLTNNELDLVTPYLTVNTVDIPSVSDILSLQIFTPTGYSDILQKDYFTVFGSFIFTGSMMISGVKNA